ACCRGRTASSRRAVSCSYRSSTATCIRFQATASATRAPIMTSVWIEIGTDITMSAVVLPASTGRESNMPVDNAEFVPRIENAGDAGVGTVVPRSGSSVLRYSSRVPVRDQAADLRDEERRIAGLDEEGIESGLRDEIGDVRMACR